MGDAEAATGGTFFVDSVEQPIIPDRSPAILQ
jgi:hypothetical protein